MVALEEEKANDESRIDTDFRHPILNSDQRLRPDRCSRRSRRFGRNVGDYCKGNIVDNTDWMFGNVPDYAEKRFFHVKHVLKAPNDA
uniref:Uncharacterized protein n=1 Tax=Angiostrongylus cantonensis TaxID=6313 RepID=A0A0K0DKP8_ANGCA